jgi:hypothetical protein
VISLPEYITKTCSSSINVSKNSCSGKTFLLFFPISCKYLAILYFFKLRISLCLKKFTDVFLHEIGKKIFVMSVKSKHKWRHVQWMAVVKLWTTISWSLNVIIVRKDDTVYTNTNPRITVTLRKHNFSTSQAFTEFITYSPNELSAWLLIYKLCTVHSMAIKHLINK